MKKIIISGKGGAGKSTLASLLAYTIAKRYPDKNMLIVDGDASATLPLSLGIGNGFKKYTPVGELSPRLKSKEDEDKNMEQFKEKCLIKINLAGFPMDFAYMGHHSTKECFCGYNEALSLLLDSLDKNNSYDVVVVDREAGLEHLTRNVYPSSSDFLVLVSWLSDDYFGVIKEINDTADILGSTKNRILVINDILNNYKSEEDAKRFIEKYGLQLSGWSAIRHINTGLLADGKVNEVLEADKELDASVNKIADLIFNSN
jgi:CO dehydrogenase maturation factor